MNVYFVTWFFHNKTNDGWAYKVEGKYNTEEEAERKYHEILSTHVGIDPYDNVTVMVTDAYGNPVMSRNWFVQTPEPTPEPVTEG